MGVFEPVPTSPFKIMIRNLASMGMIGLGLLTLGAGGIARALFARKLRE